MTDKKQNFYTYYTNQDNHQEVVDRITLELDQLVIINESHWAEQQQKWVHYMLTTDKRKPEEAPTKPDLKVVKLNTKE